MFRFAAAWKFSQIEFSKRPRADVPIPPIRNRFLQLPKPYTRVFFTRFRACFGPLHPPDFELSPMLRLLLSWLAFDIADRRLSDKCVKSRVGV